MRGAFIDALTELADRDRRIVLLTGDLGFMVVEPFAERFPDRFFNVGVAEQNMVGVATGLAEAGFIPFAYSIATFAALRPYELIRNGPVHHRLPVRIVGVGGGFEYGHAGPTHHAVEDIGVMRAQPGMAIVAPADHEQTRTALRAVWELPGPLYLRLGKDDRATVPGLDGRFELGRAQVVREGRDLAIVAVGAIATAAHAAAEALAAAGVDSTVMVVASVFPPPVGDLVELCARVPTVLTVEAHHVVGGLGSLVCEIVAERGMDCRVVRCGIRPRSDGWRVGSEAVLNDTHGLTPETLTRTALQALHV